MCVWHAKKCHQPMRAVGGRSWADAVFSKSAPTDVYIRYKCRLLERDLAKENLVVETKVMPFRRFSISVGGRLAFKGNFQFVESCRAVSYNAFIVQMERYIRQAVPPF